MEILIRIGIPILTAGIAAGIGAAAASGKPPPYCESRNDTELEAQARLEVSRGDGNYDVLLQNLKNKKCKSSDLTAPQLGAIIGATGGGLVGLWLGNLVAWGYNRNMAKDRRILTNRMQWDRRPAQSRVSQVFSRKNPVFNRAYL